MSGRQRHKAKIVSRLRERWENALQQEQTLCALIRDQMSKAERKYNEVLQIEDTALFVQRFGRVAQCLDSVNNMLESLTLAAEEFIDNSTSQQEDVVEDRMSVTTELSYLDSTRLQPEDKASRGRLSLERQTSDEEIKKQLTEMVQSGRRFTCASPESSVPSQNFASGNITMPVTIPFDHKQTGLGNQSYMDPNGSKSMCRETQTVSEFENLLGLSSRVSSVSVCEQTQTDSPFDILEDNDDDFMKEVYESTIEQDSSTGVVEQLEDNAYCRERQNVENFNDNKLVDGSDIQSAKSNKHKDSTEISKTKSKQKAMVVPKNVRKRINKKSGPDTDDKSSLPPDAQEFNRDIQVASSPKKSKKKSSKKKKGKKTTEEASSAETNTECVKTKKENAVDTVKESEKADSIEMIGKPYTVRQIEPTALERVAVKGKVFREENLGHEVTKVQPDQIVRQKIVSPSLKKETRMSKNSSEMSRIESHKSAALVEPSAVQSANVSQLTDDSMQVRELTGGSLLTGKITPVVVSEVVSPWCFFVQQNGLQLNHLMEQICMHMSQVGLMEPPIIDPDVGTVCLARYSKDSAFYRAYIMQTYAASVKTNSEVDVLYVDYGNRERVKVTQLRKLPDRFRVLPMQAICCALAEVIPSNKYCVWAEDDTHLFRQYVVQQQLSCMPHSSQASGRTLPLLVELIVSLPMPAMHQGGLYLSQFSIAQLMVKANKARRVEVAEQIGLLAKSGDGAEEVAILSPATMAMGVSITELSESRQNTPSKENGTVQNKNITAAFKTKLEFPSVREEGKHGQKDQISPKSETSDTESQIESQKGLQIVTDKGAKLPLSEGAAGQLGRIKEELEGADVMKSDAASVGTSDTTDFDFPPGEGHSLSNLHFDMGDLDFKLEGQEVMLAHVKSPSEFYVHIISQKSGETLDKLMKNLNTLFEQTTRRKLTNLSKKVELAENKLCCAQFLQDNNFYRGIILSLRPEKETMKGRVLVHYMDFGDEEWLPRRRIYPLPNQFCSVPRLAVCCGLAYIKPVCSDSGDPESWSEKTVKRFVEIAGLEKTLHMHVVGGSLADVKRSPVETPKALSVVLVDNTGTEEVCVNMDLINEGLAQLDSSQGSKHATATQETANSPEMKLDNWNPMEEDFLSKRNSYLIDTDDPGVATVGYKAGEDNICRYYGLGRSCWRGDRCPYRHVRITSGMTYEQEEVYATSGDQLDILPNPGSWVAIEITTILSPNHFYAILPMGNKSLDATGSDVENSEGAFGTVGSHETLDDLLAALNKEYSQRPAHRSDVWLKANCEIVVARFSQDGHWYRAKVVDVAEDKVKVFYVDFGNTEWLSEGELEAIKPQFLHLPFQAINCFLDIEPTEEEWSMEAKQKFRELVDGKTLVGHVISSSWNGRLSLELYDTSTNADVNIVDTLVDKGYATKAADSRSAGSRSQTGNDLDVWLVPG